MLSCTVVSLCLPKFTHGISLAILWSDGPVVFSLSKSIIGNSAWFFKAFSLMMACEMIPSQAFLLDKVVQLHSNCIGGTVCTSGFIFIINIELQLLKISLHGICIPP